MTSRRTLLIGGAATAGLMTIGRRASAQAPVRLRVGNVYPASHTIPVATERFKQLVEQKSGGAITVQVHNNSELGSEREMAEMVRGGSLEMVLSGLPGTGAYAPEIEVMEAFYVYRNVEDLKLITDAQIPAIHVETDLLDLSDAALSICIALFGVTALTQKRWLIFVAIVFMVIGIAYGCAGLFNLSLHSDFAAKLLS